MRILTVQFFVSFSSYGAMGSDPLPSKLVQCRSLILTQIATRIEVRTWLGQQIDDSQKFFDFQGPLYSDDFLVSLPHGRYFIPFYLTTKPIHMLNGSSIKIFAGASRVWLQG